MANHPDPSWTDLPDDLGSSRHPVLITAARKSLAEEQHERIVKYSLLMGCRIPCLLIAGYTYSIWETAWISLSIILISVPLPWMAVLIANDRPPIKRPKPQRKMPPASNAPALPRGEPHTVDG